MNTKLQFSLSLFAMSLAACRVGPDYRAPVPAVPDRWHADEKIGADLLWAKPENLKAWWRAFGDYELDRLMDRALARNLDVKIALARIEQARAERSSTRAELFPSVDVTGGVQRQDNPMPGLRPGIRYNLFEIGFDALWEIDLFGRQQRRLEAASAELEAAGDQYAQSLVTLSSELARSYIDYRNAQALLAITRSNLDSSGRPWRRPKGCCKRASEPAMMWCAPKPKRRPPRRRFLPWKPARPLPCVNWKR
ncbi:TolC family protein [Methylocaldum gracile]|uniref:TolC family protein n=1 Tax=Methylocaldum sp. 0917 TaxID=2485163 RepID=UPI001B554758